MARTQKLDECWDKDYFMENLLIKGASSQINFLKDVKKIVLLIHGFRGNPLNFSELVLDFERMRLTLII